MNFRPVFTKLFSVYGTNKIERSPLAIPGNRQRDPQKLDKVLQVRPSPCADNLKIIEGYMAVMGIHGHRQNAQIQKVALSLLTRLLAKGNAG